MYIEAHIALQRDSVGAVNGDAAPVGAAKGRDAREKMHMCRSRAGQVSKQPVNAGML